MVGGWGEEGPKRSFHSKIWWRQLRRCWWEGVQGVTQYDAKLALVEARTEWQDTALQRGGGGWTTGSPGGAHSSWYCK